MASGTVSRLTATLTLPNTPPTVITGRAFICASFATGRCSSEWIYRERHLVVGALFGQHGSASSETTLPVSAASGALCLYLD